MKSGHCRDCTYWLKNGLREGCGTCEHPRLANDFITYGEEAYESPDTVMSMCVQFTDAAWDALRGMAAKSGEDGEPPPHVAWATHLETWPDFGCVLFEARGAGDG